MLSRAHSEPSIAGNTQDSKNIFQKMKIFGKKGGKEEEDVGNFDASRTSSMASLLLPLPVEEEIGNKKEKSVKGKNMDLDKYIANQKAKIYNSTSCYTPARNISNTNRIRREYLARFIKSIKFWVNEFSPSNFLQNLTYINQLVDAETFPFSKVEYNSLLKSFLSANIKGELDKKGVNTEVECKLFIDRIVMALYQTVPNIKDLINKFTNYSPNEYEKGNITLYFNTLEGILNCIPNSALSSDANKAERYKAFHLYEKLKTYMPSALYSEFINLKWVDSNNVTRYPTCNIINNFLIYHADFLQKSKRTRINKVHDDIVDRLEDLEWDSTKSDYGDNLNINVEKKEKEENDKIKSRNYEREGNRERYRTRENNNGNRYFGNYREREFNNNRRPLFCTICHKKYHASEYCIKHPDPSTRAANMEIYRKKIEDRANKEGGLKENCLLCTGNHKSVHCIMYKNVSPVGEHCPICESLDLGKMYHSKNICKNKK